MRSPGSRSAGSGAATRSPPPSCGCAARARAWSSASHCPSMAATPPADPSAVNTTSHSVIGRPRLRRGRHTLILALLTAMALSACGGARESGDEAAGTAGASASTPSPSPSAAPTQDATPEAGTPIGIMFGDTRLGARLDDNATARELAGMLPLTLTVRDHNGVEKTAPLPRTLVTDGAPEGHDPAAGDIGYYAPGGDFVLYYDDEAPYFSGIVRIGEFDGDLDALRRLAEGSSVTVHRAP